MPQLSRRFLVCCLIALLAGIPLVLWGISDIFVWADLTLATVLVAAVAAGLSETPRASRGSVRAFEAWLQTQGIESPRLAMMGVLILLVVALRQWLQVGAMEAVNIAAAGNPDVRMRYAALANLAYVVGWALVLWSARPTIDWRSWWSIHHRELMPLGAVVLVAGVLRLLWLSDYPNIINGDEGLIGWWARGMLREMGPLEYTLSAMDGVGTFYLSLLHVLIWAFGSEVWVLRLMPALAGTVSIVTLFLLVRALYGPRVALIAAVVLATTHTHIHFSRQVAVSYIYAAAFLPVVLWGIWRMVERRRAWPALVAAAALAFHANFYVDAWAWAVLSVLVLGAWAIVQRSQMRQTGAVIGIYGAAALVGLGPQLVWAAHMPSGFFSRLEVDGSFVSGWIFTESAAMQLSVVGYVLYLYDMALQAIYATPFIDFYHADVPILDGISVCLAAIGALLVHNTIHTRRGLLLLGWFWGGVTALAVFTLPISTYHYRLFVIVPVLALFVALGIDALYRLVCRVGDRRVAAGLVGVCLVVLAVVNGDIYVQRLALDCRYGGDQMTQRAGAAAKHLAARGIRDATVVTVGRLNDLHAGTWKSFEYLNESLVFENAFPDDPPRQYGASGTRLYFLYIPERFPERPTIEAGYATDGSYETITMCGEVFGYLTATVVP